MASKLCIHTIYKTLSTQQAALYIFLYLHNFSLMYSTVTTYVLESQSMILNISRNFSLGTRSCFARDKMRGAWS